MSVNELFDLAGKGRIVSLDEATVLSKLHQVFDTEDLTFVIGSAISQFPMASLVNGQQMTTAISSYLAKDTPCEDLIRRQIASSAFEVIFQYNECDREIRKWLIRVFASLPPKEPNPMHVALAELLARRPSHVITTNYDRFIELALKRKGVDFNAIVHRNDVKSAQAPCRCFKVHGCTSDIDSLVFKLEHERPLSGWKSSTFRSLVENRTIIVIGYSGKDFEICPALMQADAKAVFWNARVEDLRDGKFPSENAKHLFDCIGRMLFLSGDMHKIFGLGSPSAHQPYGARHGRRRIATGDIGSANVADALLEDLIQNMPVEAVVRWKALVFDAIGAPRQVAAVLQASPNAFSVEQRLNRLASCAYRRGKYRTSIVYGLRLALMKSRVTGKGWGEFAIRGGLDAAFKSQNLGNYRLAWIAYLFACAGWRNVDIGLRREYAMNMAWFEVLARAQSSDRIEQVQRRLRQTQFISLHQGYWGSFYLARDFAEENNLSTDTLSQRRPQIMPSQLGFRHIGNIPAQLESFKGEQLTKTTDWNEVVQKIQTACETDLQPARWKCALAALEKRNWSAKEKKYLSKHVLIGLVKCQYTLKFNLKVIRRTVSALRSR